MKALKIIVGLLCFILPIAGRFFWLYQTGYQRSEPVEIPAFEDIKVPQPPASSSEEELAKTNGIEDITILIDHAHDNIFSLSEIESLRHALVLLGAQVEVTSYDTQLGEALKYANAYIIISPSMMYYDDEVRAIVQFIQRGGKLLVIADPTRRDLNNFGTDVFYADPTGLSSIEIANQILAPYDMSFANDYVYNVVENEGNFRNVIFESFSNDKLTTGLETVVLYGAHSITSGQKALLNGSEQTLSSITDQGGELTTIVKHKKDDVLAIGDIGFMTPPYNQVADNQQLIENIAAFLVDNNGRDRDLLDFPYLFKQPVAILSYTGQAMNSEMVSTLSSAQSAISALGYQTTIATELPDNGYDLIVFGTFDALGDLEPIILDFGLELSSEEMSEEDVGDSFYFVDQIPTRSVINIPDLGTFTTESIGLILYIPTDDGNTVVLLASSMGALAELGGNLLNAYADLSACFVQENIGICQLYTVDTEFIDYGFDSFEELELDEPIGDEDNGPPG